MIDTAKLHPSISPRTQDVLTNEGLVMKLAYIEKIHGNMTGYNRLVTDNNIDVCFNAMMNNITETLSVCDGFITDQMNHVADKNNIHDIMIGLYLINRGFAK
jgi:hypothetical protein